MFNFLILGFFLYFFYKNNIKTGKFKQFMRSALPSIIDHLQNIVNKIDGNKSTRRSNQSNYMSVEEARQILGLKNNPSKDDVLSAFKKLMLVNHPDKGGSEYIAAKIIQAKETLIKSL